MHGVLARLQPRKTSYCTTFESSSQFYQSPSHISFVDTFIPKGIQLSIYLTIIVTGLRRVKLYSMVWYDTASKLEWVCPELAWPGLTWQGWVWPYVTGNSILRHTHHFSWRQPLKWEKKGGTLTLILYKSSYNEGLGPLLMITLFLAFSKFENHE